MDIKENLTSAGRALATRLPLRFEREGIAGNIGLILLAVSIIIVVATYLIFLGMSKDIAVTDVVNDGMLLSKVLANSAMGMMDEDKQPELKRLVTIVSVKDDLLYCMILDNAGKILASSNEREIGSFFRDPIMDKVKNTVGLISRTIKDEVLDKQVYEFYMPIESRLHRLGTVRIGMIYGLHLLSAIKLIKVFAIVSLFVVTSISAVYYVVRIFLRPLNNLKEELEQLLKSRELRELNVNSRGEIKGITDQWNAVLQSVEEKYRDIEHMNSELEIANRLVLYEKKRTESIIENLQNGIICLNPMGNVVLTNRSAENLLRIDPDESQNKHILDMIDHNELRGFLEVNLGNKFNIKTQYTEVSLNGDESEEVLKLTFSPLLDIDNQAIGSLITIRDITQQKLADKMTGEFVSSVTHELRTPLTSIKSYVEMLMDQEVDDPVTKVEFYNTINEEADRLAHLIDNLLNLSKMEVGSLVVNKTPVKIKRLIKESLEAVEAQAKSRGIGIDLVLPDKMSPASVDKTMLGVIFSNLFGNALKYTQDGGRIRVITEETKSDIVVHIEDTGIGIPEEDLPNVFKKFYRAGNTEEMKVVKGSGLGLALVRQIVELHGGNITVTSQVGKGSHFILTFPKA